MTEDELQTYVVHWLQMALPLGSVWHHSPNEGKRHVAYKIRLKKLGMAAGWPDLEIFVPDNGWRDKAAKGPRLLHHSKAHWPCRGVSEAAH